MFSKPHKKNPMNSKLTTMFHKTLICGTISNVRRLTVVRIIMYTGSTGTIMFWN